MKPQPITLRQQEAGDKLLVFAVNEWPECVEISCHVLRNSHLVEINDNGVIVVTVENGYAAYKLATEQHSDFGITCALLDAAWSPPPPETSDTAGVRGEP